jgi:hypothetical protein
MAENRSKGGDGGRILRTGEALVEDETAWNLGMIISVGRSLKRLGLESLLALDLHGTIHNDGIGRFHGRGSMLDNFQEKRDAPPFQISPLPVIYRRGVALSARVVLDQWRMDYNHRRPHGGLQWMTPAAPRPRPGAVSFLHRFGSAINRHVHPHACVTDDVFTQSSDGYSATFFPARPITAADLTTLTERMRRRVVRWFRMQRLLDADAAGDIRLIAFITEPGPIWKVLTHLGEPLEPPPVSTAREKSGFKAGLRRRDKSGLERGQEAPRHLHDRAASSPIGSGCCSSWSSLLGRRVPKCHWPTYPSRPCFRSRGALPRRCSGGCCRPARPWRRTGYSAHRNGPRRDCSVSCTTANSSGRT